MAIICFNIANKTKTIISYFCVKCSELIDVHIGKNIKNIISAKGWDIHFTNVYGSPLSKEENFKVYFPDLKLCTDNAAMIALAGLERYKKKKFDKHNFEANPRWQLDSKAKFLKGAGVKI